MSMQIVSMPRGLGKTRHMVHWLKAAKNRTMVCFSEQERRRILDTFFNDKERAEYEDRVITLNQQLTRRGKSQQVVGFDNLDLILRNIVSPNQLGPCTITGREL